MDLKRLRRLIDENAWERASQLLKSWDTPSHGTAATATAPTRKEEKPAIYYFLKGRVLEHTANPDVVLAWWQKSTKMFPNAISINKRLIYSYLAGNDIDESIKALRKTVNKFPKEHFFIKQEINLYFKLSEYDKAINSCLSYCTQFPGEPFGYLKLIQALLKLERLEEAEKILQSKSHIFSLGQLHSIYSSLNLYYSIEKICNEGLAKKKNDFTWLCQKLRIFLFLEKSEEECDLLLEKIKTCIKNNKGAPINVNPLLTSARLSKKIEAFLFELDNMPGVRVERSKQFDAFINSVKLFREYATPNVELKPCSDRKVDIVYTWVDMSQPEFLEKFKNANGFYPSSSNNIQQNQHRYTDNGEIRLSLQTVQKYFNEVNHIYIITNDQYFDLSFLDESFQEKVTFVNQEDIMPKEYVASPIFNSTVIETFIWNIPNLAETFIYFCDDYFLGSQLSIEEHIFGDGMIPYATVCPQKKPKHDFVERLLKWSGDRTKSQAYSYNAYQLYQSEFGSVPHLKDLHLPLILRREACEKTYERFLPHWKDTFFKNRLRTNSCYYSLVMFAWYSIQEGYQIPGPYHEYIKRSLILNTGLNKESLSLVKRKRPLFFCINFLPNEKSKSMFNDLADTFMDPRLM